MHVFHFGSSQRRLFGVYHPPEVARAGSAGVVICQPYGHEYIRAHRTVRNLAARLAASGVHVLRFDYYGTGDSYGDGQEGRLGQWKQDVDSAIDELKDMADLPRVSLVGVRLGSLLAALSAGPRKDVEALILWDPVVRGGEYLDGARELEARWLASRPWMQVPSSSSQDGELIGFPLSAELEAELRSADMFHVPRWPKRVAVATSREVDASALLAHFDSAGVPHAAARVECDCEWTRVGAVHLTLLAAEMTQEIASHVTGRATA